MTEKAFQSKLLPEFVAFLKKALPDLQQDLLQTASHIVQDNASKVKSWVTKSSTGELSSEDLKWLIASQMDLTRLHVLKEAGLSLAKFDEFRQAMFNSLVKSIFKTNIFH